MLMRRGFGKAVLWVALITVTAAAAASAGQNGQQVNRGEQILNRSCMSCHDLRPIETQALDRDGWTKVVTSMIEKGADVKSEDIPVFVQYLVRYHGPLPEGRGKAILLNTCTVCHNLERVKERLVSREEWEDTLGSMLNEGAQLTDEDFPVLLSYLARNFRPQ